MNAIKVYTIANWHLITYLWPNGDYVNNDYIVFLDSDSDEYAAKLTKLRAVNSYLADEVAVWSDSNGVTFTPSFEVDKHGKSTPKR